MINKVRNSVRHMSKTKGIESDSTITMLSTTYKCLEQYSRPENKWEEFIEDLRSRIFLSYRNKFKSIQGYTSDTGWGCMYRTGQMMLAQAFQQFLLGRDWRLHKSNVKDILIYLTIIRWFGDTSLSPYSIHKMASEGYDIGVKPGEWHSPTTVSVVLRKLVSKNHSNYFQMYVAKDSCIRLDSLKILAKNSKPLDPRKMLFSSILCDEFFHKLKLNPKSRTNKYKSKKITIWQDSELFSQKVLKLQKKKNTKFYQLNYLKERSKEMRFDEKRQQFYQKPNELLSKQYKDLNEKKKKNNIKLKLKSTLSFKKTSLNKNLLKDIEGFENTNLNPIFGDENDNGIDINLIKNPKIENISKRLDNVFDLFDGLTSQNNNITIKNKNNKNKQKEKKNGIGGKEKVNENKEKKNEFKQGNGFNLINENKQTKKGTVTNSSTNKSIIKNENNKKLNNTNEKEQKQNKKIEINDIKEENKQTELDRGIYEIKKTETKIETEKGAGRESEKEKEKEKEKERENEKENEDMKEEEKESGKEDVKNKEKETESEKDDKQNINPNLTQSKKVKTVDDFDDEFDIIDDFEIEDYWKEQNKDTKSTLKEAQELKKAKERIEKKKNDVNNTESIIITEKRNLIRLEIKFIEIHQEVNDLKEEGGEKDEEEGEVKALEDNFDMDFDEFEFTTKKEIKIRAQINLEIVDPEEDENWMPLIVFVPIRLGLKKFNKAYSEPLKEIFSFSQMLGIVGGKPNTSLYFVAVQDNNLYYLDPHKTQTSVETHNRDKFDIKSYNQNCIYRLKIKNLDPSMMLGFLLKDKNDYLDFVKKTRAFLEKWKKKPIFSMI
ncbi:cysteine protease atg4 [Anaeramoeba flamelloides]|uniref:Cysteine protease n=1 Tax=Anaeramoeba flamelloides TaxID=1746091 RepID=A0AAV7YHI4_9EUKA|nr:cysteine protease atg4 [Anaeramoeba flamelloides]